MATTLNDHKTLTEQHLVAQRKCEILHCSNRELQELCQQKGNEWQMIKELFAKGKLAYERQLQALQEEKQMQEQQDAKEAIGGERTQFSD